MPETAQQERGKYLVIEGPEGAGKTTQIKRIIGRLALKGIESRSDLREPGGTPMGEALRPVIKNEEIPRTGLANMYLFSAARADLLELIKVEVENGKWVICDRNHISTNAYQVSAEGVDYKYYETLTQPLSEIIEPDITLILMISENEQKKRLDNRGGTDYFESLGPAFHNRVRMGYLLASTMNQPLIDGEGDPDQIEKIIWSYIEPLTEGEEPPFEDLRRLHDETSEKYEMELLRGEQ